jgi:hypothetical protein
MIPWVMAVGFFVLFVTFFCIAVYETAKRVEAEEKLSTLERALHGAFDRRWINLPDWITEVLRQYYRKE